MKSATLATALVLGLASSVAAQTPQPPPTYEAAVLRTWKALHDKILVMAKDTQFPESKLGWKPHPDSRSMADEFRHVTIGLRMTTAVGRGEKFDFEAEEKAADAKPKTRASIVSEMEAAVAESYALLEKGVSPRLIGWIDHQGEHYGKLVTAYRVNGVVPPVSRPK